MVRVTKISKKNTLGHAGLGDTINFNFRSGATQLSTSKSPNEFVFFHGIDSPWLSAKAHHEGLCDYIQNLSSLFHHHSQQNRLRRKQELRSFIQKNPLTKEDSYAEWQLVCQDIDEYEHQLRQIIYSPAIIAIVACFEHYIRTGIGIKYLNKQIPRIKMTRQFLCSEFPKAADILTSDIDNVIQARHVLAHVNGWLEYYNFRDENNRKHFCKWADEVGFRADIGVFVADDASVSHCFHLLEPFFSGFPEILDKNVTP